MQKWISPRHRAELDREGATTTTTSFGVAMLANCVFISERMYSNSTGYTGSHDLA